MLNITPEQMDAVKFNTDAFMTLSKIAFAGVERLAALNLSTARTALDDGFAASSAMLEAHDGKALHSPAPAKTTANALAYFSDAQKIAAETQQEIAKVMNSYSSHLGLNSNAGASWSKGFEMFKGAADQIAAMTAAGSKAASEATAQMTRPFSSDQRKTA